MAALRASLAQVHFGSALLFTDSAPDVVPEEVRVVPIRRLRSGRDYSEFLLLNLVNHIATDYCLIVQWDGFVLDARQWDPKFLDYDYIGAPWPQFADGHDVGNGGFSLRSRRLLQACQNPEFICWHPEDVAIGRVNRELLERDHGIVFAEKRLAERFAFERTTPRGPTFGFHGIFNMIPALGADRFWELYRTLDDRSNAVPDYQLLMRQIVRGPKRMSRGMRLSYDRIKGLGRS